ncbi:hypothetical protein MD484_g1551, partial [Candolleomyces efflorescens]
MPCVEHLSPASYSSPVVLRAPSDSHHPAEHGVLNQRSQQVEKRGLLGIVSDIVTGVITAAANTITTVTDAVGLTNSDPEMPPPGNGSGGNNGGGDGGGAGNGNGNGNGSGSGSGNGNGNGNTSTSNNGGGQATPGGNQNPGGGNNPGTSSTSSSPTLNHTPPGSGPTPSPPPSAPTESPINLPSDQTPPIDGSQDGDIAHEVPGPSDSQTGGGSMTEGSAGSTADGSDTSSITVLPSPVANAAGLAVGGGNQQSSITKLTTDSNGRTLTVVLPAPTETGGNNQDHDGKPSSASRIAIGLGVAFAILLILIGFFLLRRRRIARRQNRRQQWWFGRRPLSKEYQDEKISPSPVPVASSYKQRRVDSNSAINIPLPPSTTSLSSRPNSFTVSATLPTPPPMAEIRNPLNSIDFLDNSPPPSPTQRLSDGTLDSEESSHVVVARHLTLSTSTVAVGSVRPPPSPRGTIAFPEISPLVEAAIDRTSAYQFQPRSVSRLSSSSSSSKGTIRSGTFESGTFESGSGSGGLHEHPNIEISSRASSNSPDPFSDDHSNPFSDPTTPMGPSFSSSNQNNTSKTVYQRYSASSTVETDPFSGSIIASTCYGTFDEFETVRVHFLGNLSDELSVRRGEEVRVLKLFEDGWALVEKACHGGDGAQDAERGVIPAECLREMRSRSGCQGFDEYPRRVESYTTSSAQFRT